jgi:TonB dependent receptor
MNVKKHVPASKAMQTRHTALALAIALGFGYAGHAHAQATTGAISGTAPVATGEVVRVQNVGTGLSRDVPVDSSGRYYVASLPTGTYTVSLVANGQVVASQENVHVTVAGAVTVPFASTKETKNLGTVTVTADSVPQIDVTSTRQSAVMTAQQLKDLPIAHNAESIAILAPGVTFGGSSLGTGPNGAPLVSIGGNTVVENAYYINGFNTTDPIGGAGGVALPYFAVAEQQTITSGYGPEYGRSTGGVISQVGQRGSNQWHAGVYVDYRPSWAESDYKNIYYSNPLSPVGSPGLATQGTTNYPAGYGQIENGQKQNSDWETVYDAYISGPLIKDKLFFYLTAEWQHDSNQAGVENNGVTSPAGFWNSSSTSSPKIYAKLDWNITDNNILELTGVKSDSNVTSNNYYNYNYSNQSVANYYGPGILTKNDFNVGILKYTSYITDNLTLEVLYGQMDGSYYATLPGGSEPQVLYSDVPTTTPGYANLATVPNLYNSSTGNPDHTSKVANLRVDLDWKITDDHDLKFGIDNMQTRDDSDGYSLIGGSSYVYFTGLPIYAGTAPYVNTPVVGNYVQQNFQQSDLNLGVRQKAQYVEDRWQVTPTLLLDLGLRNDQFTNIAPGGVQYIRETSPQWAPRLGFSWDVFGDSSAKLFGNAGRYYLALPTGLAARNTTFGSVLGQVTYTYTSIGPNGIPQGLTPLPVVLAPGVTTPGFYSPDGENGVIGNGKDYASTNLKPEYQDEYVLGFQKNLGDTGLVFGTTATYQKTGNIIDDTDLFSQYSCSAGLVNPGKTNYIPCGNNVVTWDPNVPNPYLAAIYPPGVNPVLTFPAASRKYYGLETYLEHTWDGKWYGKIDYLFSKSYGSTEGPTDTAIGQISNQTQVSKGKGGLSGSTTAQWDFPDLMEYANGEQPNSRRHTLKAFGAYSITPEWTVSGTYIIQSGAPNECLSGFGPTVYPDLYGGAYQHFCGGVPGGDSATGVGYGGMPSPPGDSGHSPWTHQLNLALTYVPEWGNKHLTFQAMVHNVFNEQNPTLLVSAYIETVTNGGGVYNPVYKTPVALEAPRYMDFSVKFDW